MWTPPDLPPLADEALAAQVQQALDRKTKPLGALGRIEALALQIALIQGVERPRLERPQLLLAAADHGLSRRGVSAYPREVTGQMVRNILGGGAAISVLARQHGLGLQVADAGVDADLADLADLHRCSQGRGTADSTGGPAMRVDQAEALLEAGTHLLRGLPGHALLLGEMGIGNTSAASLLMQRLSGLPLERCVGCGTGLDDAGLARKQGLLAEALQANAAARTPLQILAALGGFEIALLAGASIAAAAERRVVVVDGFIATAAVAVGEALRPGLLQACVFSHCSAEGPHRLWLQHLKVQPLLDLDLRLGEGSGAALAWPLLQSACLLLNEMASFESAGVTQR